MAVNRAGVGPYNSGVDYAPMVVTSGGAGTAGTVTLVSGVTLVNTTAALTASRILLQRKTAGGTIGMSTTILINPGSGFTITSDNLLDTSTYYWFIAG